MFLLASLIVLVGAVTVGYAYGGTGDAIGFGVIVLFVICILWLMGRL